MLSDCPDDLDSKPRPSASVEEQELSAIIVTAVSNSERSRISQTDKNKRVRVLAKQFPSLFGRSYQIANLIFVTPLAAMCICRASRKTIKAVYRAYPEAINRRSFWDFGDDQNYHRGEDLISKLVGESGGELNKTPLQIAFDTDFKMARCLLQLCPAATLGRLPLHFCLLKLEDHLEDKKFARMIIDLVKAEPKAAGSKLTGHYSVLPLQVAIEHIPTRTTPKIFTRIIEELLVAYPKAAKDPVIFLMSLEKTHRWECRLLMVAFYVSQMEGLPLTYTRLFPLHAILQCQLCYMVPMLKASIKKYRDRLLHLDSKYGFVPIHLFIKRIIPFTPSNSRLWKILLYMVKVEPRVGLVRDPDTGLYPFLMVAAMMSQHQGRGHTYVRPRVTSSSESRLITSKNGSAWTPLSISS